MNKLKMMVVASIASTSMMAMTPAHADLCSDVSYADFQTAAKDAYVDTNSLGFQFPMWATLMNAAGKVCHVYSVKGGDTPVDNGGFSSSNNAWLLSRIISAQKANTANGLSIQALSISTGAVSVATYPGGSLYGLQHSNPVDTAVAYAGSPGDFGTAADPLAGTFPGGVNVFGGGVALYTAGGYKRGAVGVSGDSSCRDHAMAYRLRIELGLDNQPNDDGLALTAVPAGLFEQPFCGNGEESVAYPDGDSSPADLGIRPDPNAT